MTVEEARLQLGLETQRRGVDQASARTTPVPWALVAFVTWLALRRRHSGQMLVPAPAWVTGKTFTSLCPRRMLAT